ncbi:MAG: AraC family transcriptional regulator [Bacillus subtilis]|nr:AraC family transcriptional regulator [Bacillus subtilis]
MNEHIEAVGRMQDYIETHLTKVISLVDLAKVAGYSPFHAARLFKEHTGKSPFDYLRLMRLTASAKVLQKGEAAVIDVAFDFVFASHEGFTKAFSKAFGINPLRYSKQTPPIPFFLPTHVVQYHAAFLEGGKTMSKESPRKAIFVQVVERPRRKLLLLRAKTATDYFAYCEEVGCDVWGILTSVTDALYEPDRTLAATSDASGRHLGVRSRRRSAARLRQATSRRLRFDRIAGRQSDDFPRRTLR